MTRLQYDDPEIKTLDIDRIFIYLHKTGWQQIEHPNENIWLFQGASDDFGNPINLVLPRYADLWDTPILLAKVINLIAAIEKQSPHNLISIINTYQTVELTVGA
jgi:hypothetical protein